MFFNTLLTKKYSSFLFIFTLFMLTAHNQVSAFRGESELKTSGGAAIGGVLGAFMAEGVNICFNHYSYFNDNFNLIQGYRINPNIINLLMISSCTFVGWKIVHKLTLKGKLKDAKKEIDNMNQELFEIIKNNDDQIVLNKIKELFTNSPFPLAIAFENLTILQAQLVNANQLILLAQKNNDISSKLFKEYEYFIDVINIRLPLIAKAMQILKNNPDFCNELTLKNKYDLLENQKKMHREMELQTMLACIKH